MARSLDIVGDWWTLLIVRDAFLGLRHFDEFREDLGIARNILSTRLQKLVDEGIFSKEASDVSGHHHQYLLTKKGHDLWAVLTALRLWGDKWVFDGQPPFVAVDRESGAVVSQLLTADNDGNPIALRSQQIKATAASRS